MYLLFIGESDDLHYSAVSVGGTEEIHMRCLG